MLFTGPLYCTAMFKPESLWGKLGRFANSKRYMEACMFFSAMDREITSTMQPEAHQVFYYGFAHFSPDFGFGLCVNG